MDESIGERIKSLRSMKGISQNKLAKFAGISQAGLSAIENTTKSPSMSTLALIARALDVSVAELMGERDNTQKVTDNDIKFALFGVDPTKITDAQFEEVKRFARFIREQKQNGNLD